jgi:glyoxylase-like metal-dependent hydrolase (beta-lactamase superfamily II)
VDTVVLRHLDGLGATTAFTNARYVLPAGELDRVDAANEAARIQASGQVATIEPDHAVTGAVRIECGAGHSPSHSVVFVESGGRLACIAGHLFLHPAQVAAPGPRAGLDELPEVAGQTRVELLERLADAEGLLIGPLFAAPGGGTVVRTDSGYQLSPSSW